MAALLACRAMMKHFKMLVWFDLVLFQCLRLYVTFLGCTIALMSCFCNSYWQNVAQCQKVIVVHTFQCHLNVITWKFGNQMWNVNVRFEEWKKKMSGSRLNGKLLKDGLRLRFRINRPWPHQSVAHTQACWEGWITQLQKTSWRRKTLKQPVSEGTEGTQTDREERETVG